MCDLTTNTRRCQQQIVPAELPTLLELTDTVISVLTVLLVKHRNIILTFKKPIYSDGKECEPDFRGV